MSALVIIPTYNERDNIKKLIDSILEPGLDIEILIIDDNSPDGTGKVADKISASEKRVKVLHRPEKEGLGKAYLEGFTYGIKNSGADYIIQMDADLSHDPNCIPKFLEEIKDCDVVVGSRFYQGRISIVNWPLSRLIFSYGACTYVKLFSRLGLSDPTSGFKCFRRAVIERILENSIISDGYAFQIEINYICKKLGFKMREMPIVFYGRDKGFSKMQILRTILDAVSIVWLLKFKKFKAFMLC
jgi:dolichol-phosphate mannosyltransferase